MCKYIRKQDAIYISSEKNKFCIEGIDGYVYYLKYSEIYMDNGNKLKTFIKHYCEIFKKHFSFLWKINKAAMQGWEEKQANLLFP